MSKVEAAKAVFYFAHILFAVLALIFFSDDTPTHFPFFIKRNLISAFIYLLL